MTKTSSGFYNEDINALHVHITGPRIAYDILSDETNPLYESIRQAIYATLPENTYIDRFSVKMELINIDSNWQTELLELAQGKGVNNQASDAIKFILWSNLRFRSMSEVKIAQALDRSNILFFPNCKARLGFKGNRRNREADFLVCHEGKMGILEVDGEPFHPPSRTSQDHERDRLFRENGILVVEHFDANDCFQNPDKIVNQFLDILSKT